MEKIIINDTECIGCNLCVELCPGLFTESDFTPIPTLEDVTGIRCAQDAVDFCPVDAIKII